MALGEFGKRMRARLQAVPAAPTPRRAARSVRRQRRIYRHRSTSADRCGAAASRLARKVESAWPSPSLPGLRARAAQQRALQRRDGGVVARRLWRRAAASGCLSSASSVTGSRPPSAASAASRANTPAGVSAKAIAAGIVHLDLPAFERRQRRGAPARGRASPARRSCLASRPPRARRPRWPAPPPRHWRPRSSTREASACAMAASKSFFFALQRSVVAAGRKASDTSHSRPFAGANCSTSLRLMRIWSSSACMANCAWPAAGAPSCVLSSALPAISAHEASSSSMSRPGSTSAPCGSDAMVESRFGGRRHGAGGTCGDHRLHRYWRGVWPPPRSAGRAARPLRWRYARRRIARPARIACNFRKSSESCQNGRGRRAPVCRDCPISPAAWSYRPSAGRERRRGRARPTACWRSAASLRRRAIARSPISR